MVRRGAGFAALGAAAVALGVAAEPMTLSPQDMHRLAVHAAGSGDHAAALKFSGALLERDPEDLDALVIQSRAARDAGDLSLARKSARTAWALAETDTQKFAAALVRAQALATGGNRTAAQLWLRRAAHVAPDEATRQAAVRDFRYVRARNPLQMQFSFSLAPVSNLNNGSVKDTGTYTFPFFGNVEAELSGAAKALSGLETAVSANARYRILDRTKDKTDLIVSFSNRSYTLSDDAKKQAPGAKGSDFDFTSASLTLAHTGKFEPMPGPYRVAASFQQTWYGGEEYTRVWRGSVRQDILFGKTTSTYLSVGASRQDALGRTTDADTFELGTGLRHRLANGNQIRVDLSRTKSSSDSSSLDYVATDVAATFELGEPVLGLGWSFGLSTGHKAHDGSMARGIDRVEDSYGGSITAVLSPLDMYGFVPTVALDARKVESNLSQYDREEFGFRLGLESAF